MNRTVILYGFSLAALIVLMKYIEYQFFTKRLSLEFYLGVVAVFFTGLGIWAGLRLTRRQVKIIGPEFTLDETELTRLEISKRELEVLKLMAIGLSNQEIAINLKIKNK